MLASSGENWPEGLHCNFAQSFRNKLKKLESLRLN